MCVVVEVTTCTRRSDSRLQTASKRCTRCASPLPAENPALTKSFVRIPEPECICRCHCSLVIRNIAEQPSPSRFRPYKHTVAIREILLNFARQQELEHNNIEKR